MEQFFYPRRIAVAGVSAEPGNLGRLIIQNLKAFGFEGEWCAVGHLPGEVFDQPIYPSVLDIPGKIDLTVILTRPEFVPGVAEDCGKKGIKRLTISTAGFSEYSPAGAALEQELLAVSRQFGIRFIGPNCLAVVNMENGVCLPFSIQDPVYWRKGPVGIISQSGTVAVHYAKHLSYGKTGVGKVASIGNKLDVDEVDLLEYFISDPRTELIFIYLESMSRPRDLLALAASTDKPIILQKSNTSSLSHGVAKSHTNAVAGDDDVTEFALQQAGVVRVRDIYEAMNCVKAALLPPLKGNRLAVMSPGGGTAVMAADEANRNGFDLPPLPPEFLSWLEEQGRAGIISLTNPMDLGDIYDLDTYIPALEQIMKFPEIDGIFLDIGYASEMAGLFSYARLFDYCSRVNSRSEKPVFFRANVAHPQGLQDFNEDLDVPYFESMPGAFAAIRKLMAARNMTPARPVACERPAAFDRAAPMLQEAVAKNRRLLDREGFDILNALNVATAGFCYVAGEEIDRVSGLRLYFPVAVKAVGEALHHKTEAGGVCLGLKDLGQVSDALTAMLKNERLSSARGFLIQRMIAGGVEMIVGGRRDPQFGPVALVGMGGTLVELLSDVIQAPAPVDVDMAERMIRSLKGYPLLSGFRGSLPADVPALCHVIKAISDLMYGFPVIEEIDLNPVKVFERGQGTTVVDCKIFLKSDNA